MFLSLLLLLLTSGLTIFLLWQSAWKAFYWRRHGVRGPRGWPICGSMWQFFTGRKHYGDIYEMLYTDYPDVPYVGMYRLFNEPAVLLRSQELIKEVMVRNFQHFQDNVLWVDRERDPLVWCNPFIAKGGEWRERRAELVPIFTPNKVKMSFPHIQGICKRLMDFLDNKWQSDCIDMKALFSRFTLDVVASASLGLDAEAFTNKDSDFVSLAEDFFLPNPYSLLDTTALLFSPTLAKLMNYYYAPLSLQNWLRSIVGRILDNRAKRPHEKHVDFLQWLLDAKEPSSGLDRQTIIGHCSTFLIEGFETSSSLMAFACYQYALNPAVLRRVQAEIDEVLRRYDNELCCEAINEMPYLEASLYETLRLYPALTAMTKHCTKSFELPAQSPHGQPFRVPAGMVVVVPVSAIHNDPDIYAEPHEFRPERFMEPRDDQEEQQRQPLKSTQRLGCKFLGFGGGPRMCPGIRFALAQSKAGLVSVLSKYSVQLPAASDRCRPLELATTTFVTNAKHGVWLKLKPRARGQ